MQKMAAPTPSPDSDAKPRHHRRWPWVVGIVAAIVVIPLIVLGVLYVNRERPGAKPLDEAVESYREGVTSTSSTPDQDRPTAGVYSAMGTGHAALSFPPLSQEDGDVLPVTVQNDADGCWVVRLDYNQAHWQTWNYCPGDTAGSVVEKGGQTHQRWDLGATKIENTSTFVCTPPAVTVMPDAEPGTTWDASCEGTNTQVADTTISAGPYTFVGEEQLTIGGETVSAQHYNRSRTMSGAQTGEESSDVWFAVGTGLPVRSERSLRIESSSPVGAITYTEDGSWQLTSLQPNS